MNLTLPRVPWIVSASTPVATAPVAKSICVFDLEDDRTKFDTDPLALAVAAKAKRDGNGWSMEAYKDKLLPEDIAKAADIRDYYAKKFTWAALKTEKGISSYRSAVIRLLSLTEGWDLTSQDQGLFYKLPFFYDEDTFYDSLKKKYIVEQKNYATLMNQMKLEFIGSRLRWQGKSKLQQYWFATENNRLASLRVLADNPFLELFEEKIKDPIYIESIVKVDRLQEMYYYNVSHKFKIIKE